MTDHVVLRTDALMNDADQIIEAIRSGCVDAFVVEEREGQTVYALETADLPYNALVQKMQQGAAMLNSDHRIMYCNPSLSALLGVPAEPLVGTPLQDFIHSDDRDFFERLIEQLHLGPSEGELRIRKADDSIIPTKFSLSALSRDKSITGVLVTDLTTEKAHAELAARIQSVQDEERRGIARELHDSVGQLLAAIGMNLTRFRKESTRDESHLMPLIEDSASMVDQVSKEIRTISHLLHPPLLDVAGLSAAVRWYIDGFCERSGIQVDVEIPSDCGRLSNEAEIAIFRVVQEGLTNVYRHSGSKRCSVTMAKDAGRLRVEIRDEGRGMPSRKKRNGHSSAGLGLRGMHERLRQLGGTLEVHSTEQGTTVTATIPVSDTIPSAGPQA
jgi:two-component system, NarL family, sensor kinase